MSTIHKPKMQNTSNHNTDKPPQLEFKKFITDNNFSFNSNLIDNRSIQPIEQSIHHTQSLTNSKEFKELTKENENLKRKHCEMQEDNSKLKSENSKLSSDLQKVKNKNLNEQLSLKKEIKHNQLKYQRQLDEETKQKNDLKIKVKEIQGSLAKYKVKTEYKCQDQEKNINSLKNIKKEMHDGHEKEKEEMQETIQSLEKNLIELNEQIETQDKKIIENININVQNDQIKNFRDNDSEEEKIELKQFNTDQNSISNLEELQIDQKNICLKLYSKMEENNKLQNVIEGIINEIDLKNLVVENTYQENKKLQSANKDLEIELMKLYKDQTDYKNLEQSKSIKIELDTLEDDTSTLIEIIKNRDALLSASTQNQKFLEDKFKEYAVKFDLLIKKNHHLVSMINKIKTLDSKQLQFDKHTLFEDNKQQEKEVSTYKSKIKDLNDRLNEVLTDYEKSTNKISLMELGMADYKSKMDTYQDEIQSLRDTNNKLKNSLLKLNKNITNSEETEAHYKNLQNNLKNENLSAEKALNEQSIENLKLKKQSEMKDIEISSLKEKLTKVKDEQADFKNSLSNVGQFQQKEIDNLKVIDLLKKEIDQKDKLLLSTKERYEVLISDAQSEKEKLLEEQSILRKEQSKSEYNATISKQKIVICLLNHWITKAKNQIIKYKDYEKKYEESIVTIEKLKETINITQIEKNKLMTLITQYKQKIEDAEKNQDENNKKSLKEQECKKIELKKANEERDKLSCEKGLLNVKLKNCEEALKKEQKSLEQVKVELETLKAQVATEQAQVAQPQSQGQLQQNLVALERISELEKQQQRAKNAMASKLNNNSNGFDLPQSLRVGSAYNDKFKQRNIHKTE